MCLRVFSPSGYVYISPRGNFEVRHRARVENRRRRRGKERESLCPCFGIRSIEKERERSLIFSTRIYTSSLLSKRDAPSSRSPPRDQRCDSNACNEKAPQRKATTTTQQVRAAHSWHLYQRIRTHATTRVLPFARAKTYSGGRSDESAQSRALITCVWCFVSNEKAFSRTKASNTRGEHFEPHTRARRPP